MTIQMIGARKKNSRNPAPSPNAHRPTRGDTRNSLRRGFSLSA